MLNNKFGARAVGAGDVGPGAASRCGSLRLRLRNTVFNISAQSKIEKHISVARKSFILLSVYNVHSVYKKIEDWMGERIAQWSVHAEIWNNNRC
jgi:hypothetical protein